MADTEFDETNVDLESFNDDNASDMSSYMSVDLYDSDYKPLPGSVAPDIRAVDGYRFGPTVTDSAEPLVPNDWATLTGININHSISIM